MVGYAGSATYKLTAYVDMTLTRSKVKVKVTGLLNFRQLAKPCMLGLLAAMTAAPLRGFLVYMPDALPAAHPTVSKHRRHSGRMS